VFTVEYSVRAAQIAVYNLLRIDRAIPPVTPHDKSLKDAVRGDSQGVQMKPLVAK
jgi:myosin-crossreactive antigen